MPDEQKPAAGRSYQMGDVGAGARVAQGENISWVEGVARLPGGESLTRQFDTLLKRIAEESSLDEDTRALAQDKTKAVAEGIAKVQESPSTLRRALLDAKLWCGRNRILGWRRARRYPEERGGAENSWHFDRGGHEGSGRVVCNIATWPLVHCST